MRSLIARVGCSVTSATIVLTSVAAFAASVSVVVNGQSMTFDQPPIERAGRVFVPLRGVFERLGASVVYANGIINANGNGRQISLRIGSTAATINGASQYVDVPPFIVGSRTLVPLRFVAQALGAAVDWNQANQTVTITGVGAPAPVSSSPSNASFYLTNKRPAASTATLTPAIHAEFSEPVRRDTLRVSIDGRDVTSAVYANASGFDVTPGFALTPASHHVTVSGTTQAGASFSTGWSFTTTAGTQSNYIRSIAPSPQSKVQQSFTLSGVTLPNSNVHVVVSSEVSAAGGLVQVNTGTFQTDVQADMSGVFSVNVNVNAVSGGQLRVIV